MFYLSTLIEKREKELKVSEFDIVLYIWPISNLISFVFDE